MAENVVSGMSQVQRRALVKTVRATEHTLGSARRVGGSLLDRIQLVLARIDRSLATEYEPFSLRAADNVPPEVRKMVEEAAHGESVWRKSVVTWL